MKTIKYFTTLFMMSLVFVASAQTVKDQKIIDDAVEAKVMLLKADEGLKTFFDASAGYVIFPNVGKGGFIIGAAAGNGVVYEKGVKVGMADLKKLNIGLQAGGQSIIEVIFFETKDALQEFKEGNFSFAAEASAVAVRSGVSFNADYKDGVAVFALPKAGLMADASVGGQKFGYHPFE